MSRWRETNYLSRISLTIITFWPIIRANACALLHCPYRLQASFLTHLPRKHQLRWSDTSMKAERIILSLIALFVGLLVAGGAFYIYQMTKQIPADKTDTITIKA